MKGIQYKLTRCLCKVVSHMTFGLTWYNMIQGNSKWYKLTDQHDSKLVLITCIRTLCGQNEQYSSGPVFIKHLKSNVYVTLNAIGSFQCNLCSHWLTVMYYSIWLTRSLPTMWVPAHLPPTFLLGISVLSAGILSHRTNHWSQLDSLIWQLVLLSGLHAYLSCDITWI